MKKRLTLAIGFGDILLDEPEDVTFSMVINAIQQFWEPFFDGSLADKQYRWSQKIWPVSR